MEKPILVIVGPTAVGKTQLAIMVAKMVDGEIISADSMQVYRDMDIGTAKPSLEERAGVPHHLIDIVPPSRDFTVAEYQELAEIAIADINKRGKVPILTGGTGLYVRAVIDGFDFPGSEDLALREKLAEYARVHGQDALHQKLAEVDPVTAQRLHPNDTRRVIRALEVYQLTGVPLSRHLAKQEGRAQRHPAVMFGLTRDRQELYRRCDLRVDRMLENGLLDEVKRLLDLGFDPRSTALQAIGYKELIGYLEGEYDLEEAVRLLKRNTRRYAKRQFTWFLRDPRIRWINLDDVDWQEAAKLISDTFEKESG